jgi:ABC-type spermidine/putrescine transport system permease subunit II
MKAFLTALRVARCVAEIWFIIGFLTAFVLKQTPYALNPLWTMILLWPWYLKAFLWG